MGLVGRAPRMGQWPDAFPPARHPQRSGHRRYRRAGGARRRRCPRRRDHRGRSPRRCHGRRRDRRRRPGGHAGVRGHPHALRRPGDLGPRAGPVERARRDLAGHGQLRRRLRPGAPDPGAARLADRDARRGRGHPRDRPRRGSGVGLGDVPRLPRRPRPAPLRPRRRHARHARPAAGLRDGRAGRRPDGVADRRRAGGDGRRRARRCARRRPRVHDQPHLRPPDPRRRPPGYPVLQRGRAAGADRRDGRDRGGRRADDLRRLPEHRRRRSPARRWP